MRKTGLYIVIIAVSFNTLQLAQFAKLPVLLEHFEEHQTRDASLTLFQFLSMHYWGNDINDNDADRDKQLPFKDQVVVHFFSCYTPLPAIDIPVPAVTETDPQIRPLQVFYPGPVPGALFRPPQA